MEINNVIDLDVYSLGQIVAVEFISSHVLSGQVVEVRFQFSDRLISVSVNDEDDTICISDKVVHLLNEDSDYWINQEYRSLTSQLVEASLQWGWSFMNQQGYIDGIQFEFTKNDPAKPIVIQLISEASTLRIRGVCSVI